MRFRLEFEARRGGALDRKKAGSVARPPVHSLSLYTSKIFSFPTGVKPAWFFVTKSWYLKDFKSRAKLLSLRLSRRSFCLLAPCDCMARQNWHLGGAIGQFGLPFRRETVGIATGDDSWLHGVFNLRGWLQIYLAEC
jgi:hypothetical protein